MGTVPRWRKALAAPVWWCGDAAYWLYEKTEWTWLLDVCSWFDVNAEWITFR